MDFNVRRPLRRLPLGVRQATPGCARVGEPGFAYHAAMVRLWGVMALRLANAEVLPFDYAAYGRDLLVYLDEVSARALARQTPPRPHRRRAPPPADGGAAAARPAPPRADTLAVQPPRSCGRARPDVARGHPRPAVVPPPGVRAAALVRGGDPARRARGGGSGRPRARAQLQADVLARAIAPRGGDARRYGAGAGWRGSSAGLTYVSTNGPVPWTCRTVSDFTIT